MQVAVYCYGDMDLAQRIYDYVSKGWFMYASPVLSNAPAPDEKVKALPISCFLTYVPDSLEGLDCTTHLNCVGYQLKVVVLVDTGVMFVQYRTKSADTFFFIQ